jgi:predicted transcriptional regulator
METPRFFIRELLKEMSVGEIQTELLKMKVRVSQPTISRIKNGRVKRTGSDTALALLRLYEQKKCVQKQETQASAA